MHASVLAGENERWLWNAMLRRRLPHAGRSTSPQAANTPPCYHLGRIPRNKGQRYPADPPRTEEVVAVMRRASADLHGDRVRAVIVILWRAGVRIQEALSLTELDLDPCRGSVLVRRGKGGRRREIGMDGWGFEHIQPWLEARQTMPVGPLFCVLDGRTRGRSWSAGAAREALRLGAVRAGVRGPLAPHQLSRTHAIELAREGVPLNIIQLQLGHQNLGVTSIYLQGIIRARSSRPSAPCRPPMIPASAGLDLRR